MNSLENEYSFLAPTWKLPSVRTPSMYPTPYDTSFSMPSTNLGPGSSYNPRYVPPNANRRPQPQPGGHPPRSNEQYRSNGHSYDQHDMPNQFRSNNGGSNHPPPPPPPPPVQKRVQIIDHNRQTPSSDYVSERESQYSYSPDYTQKQQRPPPRRNQPVPDTKSDSTHGGDPRANNFKIHEYLYGLAAPDPGSYVSAYKNQRRRVEDEKVNPKSVMTDYKTFVQNGGFGPTFGNADYLTYEEKLDTEKKRKSYSKVVREVNQYKVEEHKRMQNNGGQQRHRNFPIPMPKHRRLDPMRSNFLSAQESPVARHFSISPALCQETFDNLHPWYQTDILSGEFYLDRSPTGPSIDHSLFSSFESPANSSKTTARNVHFVPEIINDEEQIPMPSSLPLPPTTTTTSKKNSKDRKTKT